MDIDTNQDEKKWYWWKRFEWKLNWYEIDDRSKKNQVKSKRANESIQVDDSIKWIC